MLVLWLLGMHCGVDLCRTLPVAGPGQPVWSYKAIHCLWLPLLGLEFCGQTKLHSKAGFYQHWSQEQVSKSPEAPETHLCLLLPARCLLGSEPWVVLYLHELGSQ